jgi:twitching motility protein PilT
MTSLGSIDKPYGSARPAQGSAIHSPSAPERPGALDPLPSDAVRRLRYYEFTDLYLASYREGQPMARQLRSPVDGNKNTEWGIVALPREARDDAFSLWALVQERWHASGFQPEFSVQHDGVQYRCALIDSPGGLELKTFISGRPNSEPRRVWCLRRLSSTPPDLAKLGLPSWLQREMIGLGLERGLVLICGAFASGKSTTAASLLKTWVMTHGDIGVSLEDPIEMPLAGQYPKGQIFQIHVHEDNFALAVKGARRWNPRYLNVQEIRTAAAASELIHIATGGPLTMTTIHANSPIEALMSLSKWAEMTTGVDIARNMIAQSLKGVLYQSLSNGMLKTRFLAVNGKDAFTIQHKIRHGRFDRLEEDLEQQEVKRANGRPI